MLVGLAVAALLIHRSGGHHSTRPAGSGAAAQPVRLTGVTGYDPYGELLDRLIALALERHERKAKLQY